jgi:hypothetical protein
MIFPVAAAVSIGWPVGVQWSPSCGWSDARTELLMSICRTYFKGAQASIVMRGSDTPSPDGRGSEH